MKESLHNSIIYILNKLRSTIFWVLPSATQIKILFGLPALRHAAYPCSYAKSIELYGTDAHSMLDRNVRLRL